MSLAFITPQSWTPDTDATIEIMNVYSNDLLFFNQRFGGSNIEWANVIVDDLLTLTGTNGISGTPQTGVLLQPTSFLASGTMYLFAHQMATDLYPRFAYNANPNNNFATSSLVFGTGSAQPDLVIGRSTLDVGAYPVSPSFVNVLASMLTFSFNYNSSFEGVRIVDNLNKSLMLFPSVPLSFGTTFSLLKDAVIAFSQPGLSLGPYGSGAGFRMDSLGNSSFIQTGLNVGIPTPTTNLPIKIYDNQLSSPANGITIACNGVGWGNRRMIEIRINGASTGSPVADINVTFNGIATNYYDQWIKTNATTITAGEHTNQASMYAGSLPGTAAIANATGSIIIRVVDASNTGLEKSVHIENVYHTTNSSGGVTITTIRGVWNNAAAITSVTITNGTGPNFATGTSIEVWIYP